MPKYDMDRLMGTADLFGELKTGETPKGFDSLFGINNDNSNKEDREQNIPINKLNAYPGHQFRMPEGEEWDSFVESIKTHGILQPILVHEIENGEYEIISGHCRTEAARQAGLDHVPAIVMDIDDDVAISVLVGLSNKQRIYISDIEWGATYRVTYEKVKAQGRDSGGKRADEVLSELYGVSARTIQRKMRLSFLIPELAELYESKRINQEEAVDLSYLKPDVQTTVYTSIDAGYTISEEVTKLLKSNIDTLDDSKVKEIIEGEKTGNIVTESLREEVKKVGIKLNKKVKQKYFPPEYDDSNINDIIEQLLSVWAKEHNPNYIED